jgi:2-polyprenyl-3-methyl-5-hydroxy-6-metoxy-1,4-benzoquinol methylase
MDIKETSLLGNDVTNHWYYRAKAAAVMRLIDKLEPTRILDVGAGSGFFSRYLLQCTGAKYACCVDVSYAVESDSTEEGKTIQFRKSIEAVDADLVLLMDVLEHVDDDVGLLSEYVGKVPAGARFIVSVPAFRFLWSKHDEFLEHRRRYTLREVERIVEQVADWFKPTKIGYAPNSEGTMLL